MPFQPAIDEQLVIDGISYQVCAHPAIPGRPFVQEGQNSRVVQLRTAGGFVALKVQTQLCEPSLIQHAQQLQSVSSIPGLQAARRMIITAANQPALVTTRPELDYAILMPWVYGPPWQELIHHRRPLSPSQSLALARALTNLLVEIEQRGLVHGDLQSAHVMLPGLIDPAAAAPVALVDLETMHGAGVLRLPMPAPTSPYQHPVPAQGLSADRFGGALLILELLGWCDDAVRAAAATDSFFTPADLLQPTERYHTLRDALARRWGLGPAQMLDRLWQSATPLNCPLLKEWQAVLPSPRMAAAEPQAPATISPSLTDPIAPLMNDAAALRTHGQLAQALTVYRSALDRLPADDPRASEVMQTIDTIERELAQTSATPTPQRDLHWSAPVAIGVVTIILLVVLAAIGLNRVATPSPTPVTANPAIVTAIPSPTLSPSPTPAPTRSPIPIQSFRVDRIFPIDLFTGATPLEFTVQGSGLSAVRTATLRAAGYDPVALDILAGRSDNELRLRISTLNIPLAGSAPFTLELNGTPVPGAAVTLRDYSSVRVVSGVRPDYRYTGRIEEDAQGAFTRIRVEPSPESAVTEPIRNGDEVDILSEQPAGWYRVRIRTSTDSGLIGSSGYVERWLIDNTGVPPPPTPTVPPEPPRLRFVKLNENEDTRCILIQIRGINTAGWIVSIDGLRLSGAFDSGGNARVCGLRPRQEVTFTVRDEQGAPVRGGVGVPTRGSDVMFAEWR
ncbi:serine/threonine protein phosphatase [Chloroflexus islandicus]|uniref:Serine/threonine protein phosphatase n=1 Tax=Chloroflexus islandicus TaxID=1707952 RepID=A0A178M9C2_9CHLR|nr:SH3 domain-containing protein [Chloroflexus islandicus]OAN44635.1 serine/threonine protein phosphatase [Chloroflexus islandicus]